MLECRCATSMRERCYSTNTWLGNWYWSQGRDRSNRKLVQKNRLLVDCGLGFGNRKWPVGWYRSVELFLGCQWILKKEKNSLLPCKLFVFNVFNVFWLLTRSICIRVHGQWHNVVVMTESVLQFTWESSETNFVCFGIFVERFTSSTNRLLQTIP